MIERRPPRWARHYWTEGDAPPPGQGTLLSGALAFGFLLLGVQLWLLTVALDLYLGGRGRQVWQVAVVSGAILAGGIVMRWLLERRPRMRYRATDGSGRVD